MITPQLTELLCCPRCKTSLIQKIENNEGTSFECKTCSTIYPIKDGAPDFRITPNNKEQFKAWSGTQIKFEAFIIHYDIKQAKLDDILNNEIYKQIELQGKVLDVGGSQGFLRNHLSINSEYICIDPWPGSKKDALRLSENEGFLTLYPFLKEDYDFIIGLGEALPLSSGSFDWVHIRSVLDHVYDPLVVLIEANRVLVNDGQLLINLTLTDGPKVIISSQPNLFYRAYRKLKTEGTTSFIRKIFDYLHGEDTDHIHHPTSKEVISLVEDAGFKNINSKWISDTTGIEGDFLLTATK